jgi:hypothetical protein
MIDHSQFGLMHLDDPLDVVSHCKGSLNDLLVQLAISCQLQKVLC